MLQRSLSRCPTPTSHAGLESLRSTRSARASMAAVRGKAGSSKQKPSRRSYTTPSKPAHSPAESLASAPMTSNLPPPFIFNREAPLFPLSGHGPFIPPRSPITVLPMPLPEDPFNTSRSDAIFTSAPSSRSLAIIDACVHNAQDVPRAKRLFDELVEMEEQRRARASSSTPTQGESVLDLSLLNTMLRGYADMALKQDPDIWMAELRSLYYKMSDLGISPNDTSFAIVFSAIERFPNYTERDFDVPAILSDVRRSSVPVASIVMHEMFPEHLASQSLIRSLLDAARKLNDPSAKAELQALSEEVTPELFKIDPREGVPDVLPVVSLPSAKAPEILGEGASAKKEPFNLNVLQHSLDKLVQSRRDYLHDPLVRQKILEESALDAAKARLERQSQVMEDLDIATGMRENNIQKYMWMWHVKLRTRLAEGIQTMKDDLESRKRPLSQGNIYSAGIGESLLPFLTLFPPETLSIVTIYELMRLQGTGGVDEGTKLARALMGVGKAIEAEYQARLLKKHKIARPARSHGPMSASGLQKLLDKSKSKVATAEEEDTFIPEWTTTIRARVGGFCVDALMDVAAVTRTVVKDGVEYTEDQPAFVHTYEYVRGQKLGVIKTNQEISERLAKEPVYDLLHPRQLPMLVEPRPWVGPFSGGYLNSRDSVMRFKDSVEQKRYITAAGKEGKLEKVFQALDALSATPWQINKGVFDVVINVWNSGKAFADIPPIKLEVEEPVKPDNYHTDIKAKALHLAAVRNALNERRNNHSERCSINYKVAIARAFLGETFYLPHNLDFRGRAYPIPPHLNHIGDDLSRGLLKFAEGKPLGERGLRWLKIHLANVFGNDKGSFDDRARFTMEHIKDVYDSAERPLDGNQWWLQADDPWQCLATCMELRSALESPNPLEFVSNLPVHQDGTCNGLQHYAALGGDAIGAAQVNLDVTERPSDVYTFVADMVEKVIEEDKAKGNPAAIALAGKIARKVVKQTVMTTVYGVTAVGARAQIERQLRDRKDLQNADCFMLSSYLAKKVMTCIGDLFSGANAIQNWLSQSARLISKSVPPARIAGCSGDATSTTKVETNATIAREQMSAVIWESPLGLPIVQPYRKIQRKQIMTAMQSVYLGDPNKPSGVNTMKQASAFPPNFIHSLDATHMVLTALEMKREELTFASVHDSYWTHACNVDRMSEIIRDTFIDLHSRNILEDLREEFLKRYAGHHVPMTALKVFERVLLLQKGVITSDQVAKPKKTTTATITEVTEDNEATEVDESAAEAEVKVNLLPLEDVLPPLPEKGSFDVRKTKNSLYFFS